MNLNAILCFLCYTVFGHVEAVCIADIAVWQDYQCADIPLGRWFNTQPKSFTINLASCVHCDGRKQCNVYSPKPSTPALRSLIINDSRNQPALDHNLPMPYTEYL
jgi:hypothetical protein